MADLLMKTVLQGACRWKPLEILGCIGNKPVGRQEMPGNVCRKRKAPPEGRAGPSVYGWAADLGGGSTTTSTTFADDYLPPGGGTQTRLRQGCHAAKAKKEAPTEVGA